ncbi:MAG: PAS domain-containing protein, partial [bacterium]|nr:PAS domain-containing protein [bacterium]
MSHEILPILVAVHDPYPWVSRLPEYAARSIQLEIIPPIPEIVIEQLALRHYPIAIIDFSSLEEMQIVANQILTISNTTKIIAILPSDLLYQTHSLPENNHWEFIPRHDFERLHLAFENTIGVWQEASQTHCDEQEVIHLSEFYQTLLKGVQTGIGIFNANCRLVFANPALSKIFGLPSASLLNSTCQELCERIAGGSQECIIEKTFSHQHSHRLHLTRKNEIGEEFAIELIADFVKPFDKSHYVILEVRDVSHQAALEQQLRQQNDLLERLLHQAPLAIIASDRDFIIRRTNERFRDRVAPESAELPGKSLLDPAITPDPAVRDYFLQAMKAESPLPPVHTKLPGTVEPVHLAINAGPIRDEQGDVNGLVIMAEDVTEWRKLTTELAAIREKQAMQITELQLLGEINRSLHQAREINEVLYLILVAVTSDRGLGFNRAFLLLLDQTTNELSGRLAIGPADSSEAGRIWHELEGQRPTLQDYAAHWQEHVGQDQRVNEIARQITLSMHDNDSAIIQSVTSEHASILRRWEHSNESIWQQLQCDECAVVPLISKERIEGALLVDNAINRLPLQPEQLVQLERFAGMAAIAILHARWYETLEFRLQALRSAYRELRDNRDRMIRSERLSAIGEITATVVHEIRNPLAAIGGLARVLREDIDLNPLSSGMIETIISEVDRLERYIRETLEMTKPASPKYVFARLKEKVENTLQMMAGELDPQRYYV